MHRRLPALAASAAFAGGVPPSGSKPLSQILEAAEASHAGVVVSAEFAGMNRVQRQQHVYRILTEKLASGELHAISFKTLTPEEWSAQRG